MTRKKKPDADRHLHPAMSLRLHPRQADALRAIAEAEDRTYTAVVLRALRAYAEANGYTWPSAKDAGPP